MSELHDRMRQRLVSVGKSLRQASLDSGMSGDAIGKMLKNPDQSQTLETVRKLAFGLQTTPEWLAFGSGPEAIDGAPDPGSDEPPREEPAAAMTMPRSVAQGAFLVRGTVEKLGSNSILVDLDALAALLLSANRPGLSVEAARGTTLSQLRKLLGPASDALPQAEAALDRIAAGSKGRRSRRGSPG